METSKKPALLALARVLRDAGVPYAIIGGVALQVHQKEPRTTLDIDLAVLDRAAIPHDALAAADFRFLDRYEHSEIWLASDETPIQFTDDPMLAPAIASAMEIALEGVPLRVIRTIDLLHAKIRAGVDVARRRSKRLQDLVDAEALIEADPTLAQELTAEERAVMAALPE